MAHIGFQHFTHLLPEVLNICLLISSYSEMVQFLDFSMNKLLKIPGCSLKTLVYWCASHSIDPSGGLQPRFSLHATPFAFHDFTLCIVKKFFRQFP